MRKILNFGHTIGHAIETYFLNSQVKGDLLHGEAVAAGMICETYLSEKHTGLTSEDAKSIISYIERIFGKIKIEKEDIPEILNLIKQDKKNERELLIFHY